jgi:co-chaperonin GroES (HSP10)
MATVKAENGTFDLGTLKFWALGDRVLIQEDEFKSGYECPGCGGTGKSTVVRGAKCAECSGTGVVKGGIVVTEESQRRPTTGKIMSIGEKCVVLKPGDSVLFSNFAGYVVDLNRAGKNVSLRILHESEVLCALEGQLELRNLRGKSEVAEVS